MHCMSAFISRAFGLMCALAVFWMVCACTVSAKAEDPGSICSLLLENDLFGGSTDRHFTHGTRIEWLTGPIDWITRLADAIPGFDIERAMELHKKGLRARWSVSLGQNIYTPEDIEEPELIPTDRPYAGWSYAGFGLVAYQGSARVDKVELEIGMVGPASHAETVQTQWHESFGLREPRGWDHQLHDEPGVALFYEMSNRFEPLHWDHWIKTDVIPHLGGCVGNIYTYASAGLTLRVGPYLKQDFGPPRIRPSLPGSGLFDGEKNFNWYVFAALDGRMMARNIFLDGNTFRDSPSVDKKPIVGDVQVGAAVQLYRFRLAYTQVYRTMEFKGQDKPDNFGALSLSYQF